MDKLTVIIPVRNEYETLAPAIAGLAEGFARQRLEADLLIVDDGSEDATWYAVQELAEQGGNVYGMRLSRPFGKDAAIFAGLAHVNTPLCLVLDGGMDIPPLAVRDALSSLERGRAEALIAQPVRPSETGPRTALAGALHSLIRAAGARDPVEPEGFALLSRKAAHALVRFEESAPSFRGLLEWSGFALFRHAYELPEEATIPARPGPASLLGPAAKAALGLFRPRFALVFALLCLAGALAEGIHALVRLAYGVEAGAGAGILVVLTVGFFVLLSVSALGGHLRRMQNELRRRPRHIVADKTGGIFNKP